MKNFITNDNIRISYRQEGNQGPVVVLLHGKLYGECISCSAIVRCIGISSLTFYAAMHLTGWSGSHRYYDLNIEVQDFLP